MISELHNFYLIFSDELDAIKSQMDERGESMTDTGPLVKLKDAMKKMKKEIKVLMSFLCIPNHIRLNFCSAGHGPAHRHWDAHFVAYSPAARAPTG